MGDDKDDLIKDEYVADKLEMLFELKQKGILTEDEFKRQKDKYLSP